MKLLKRDALYILYSIGGMAIFLIICLGLVYLGTLKQKYISPAPDIFTFVNIVRNTNQISFSQLLAEESAYAVDEGRKPYAYFCADESSACQAVLENLAEEPMIDAFAGTYIIGLNVGQWGNDPYYAYQEFEISTVPVIFELNDLGEPTGRMINGNAWGEDVPEKMAPMLKAFFQESNNTQDQ